jgi:hypothetical protein
MWHSENAVHKPTGLAISCRTTIRGRPFLHLQMSVSQRVTGGIKDAGFSDAIVRTESLHSYRPFFSASFLFAIVELPSFHKSDGKIYNKPGMR